MLKKFFIVFLIIVGIQQSVEYLLSDGFQNYADRTKDPWTCRATIMIGQVMELFDRPAVARTYFERVVLRCPRTEYAAQAAFGVARSWDDPGSPTQMAVRAYSKFIEDYEKSPLVKDAQAALERIKGARSL